MSNLLNTELGKVMKSSGIYDSDAEIIESICEMRRRIKEHREDPEEVLAEEGFEPDYVYDLI